MEREFQMALHGAEPTAEGFVPSLHPDLPDRYVDGEDSPGFRRSLEINAAKRRN